MQNFRSGAPSAFADLKELMSLMSNASEVKKAVNDLDERLKECLEKEKAISEIEVKVQKSQSEVIGQLAQLQERYSSLSAKEQELDKKFSDLNSKEAFIHAKQKKYEEESSQFVVFKQAEMEKLETAKLLAEEKLKEADALEKHASAMKREFEAKLEKIKSI